MFVPWLELTTLGTSSEPDINDLAVPFARSGEGVYCWQPSRDGSLVICQYGIPTVGAHTLGAAVADRASALGVEVLRPEWEQGEPTADEAEEWIDELWRLSLSYFDQGPRTAPCVALVPHYDYTEAFAGHGFDFGRVHKRLGELVLHGPDDGIYPVVSYSYISGVWPFAHPESQENNLLTENSTALTVGYRAGRTPNAVDIFPAGDYSLTAPSKYDMELLPLDQIARGRWE